MVYPLAWLGIDNTMLLLVLGLLIFGRNLPDVGRSLGKGIIEFKKGLQGIEDDIEEASKAKPQPTSVARLPETASAPSYKFDPYTGKPLNVEPPAPPQARFDPYTGKPISQEQAATSSTGSMGA